MATVYLIRGCSGGCFIVFPPLPEEEEAASARLRGRAEGTGTAEGEGSWDRGLTQPTQLLRRAYPRPDTPAGSTFGGLGPPYLSPPLFLHVPEKRPSGSLLDHTKGVPGCSDLGGHKGGREYFGGSLVVDQLHFA